jgi:2-polyprenyl-6-methoxyphenol hydroxylase-like FAD-dependent oxidoreductase
MSPDTGSGATTALRDAVTLGQAIRDFEVSKEGVGRYETAMRVYAGETISQRWVVGGRSGCGLLETGVEKKSGAKL